MDSSSYVDIWFIHPILNRRLLVSKTLDVAPFSANLMRGLGWLVEHIILKDGEIPVRPFHCRNIKI